MTEQGAAADNACRDGPPGGAGLFAKGPAPRDPSTPSTSLGSRNLGARPAHATPAWRRFAASAGASRRSIPFFKGTRKKGNGRIRASENKTPEQRSVG